MADNSKFLPVEGRAWVFATANINTDSIMPYIGINASTPEEQLKYVFASLRPGWAEQVQKGDIILAGKNFGTGSSRPAVSLLVDLGIAGIVAESINDLFFRNCVNYAMPAMQCDEAVTIASEGEPVRLDIAKGEVTNMKTGTVGHGPAMPISMIEIIQAGGIHEMGRVKGYM